MIIKKCIGVENSAMPALARGLGLANRLAAICDYESGECGWQFFVKNADYPTEPLGRLLVDPSLAQL